ncbi:MAG: acyl-CoA dehydrogenase family protein, partial [Gemmatimonadetes bacterium]|nr:acyl-CoA dehydrogenase family protein [Gemmatimonadota bacterium]
MAPSPQPNRADAAWPEDHPGLLPVLPLVHVAWSDGILTSGERRVFRELILESPALDDADRAALEPWLDPDTPPSPTAVWSLRERIQALAGPEGADSVSLTELGYHIARPSGGHRPWRDPDARHALASAEAALGVLGREAVLRVLASEAPPASKPPAGALFDVAGMAAYLAHPDAELRARVVALLQDPEFVIETEIDRPTHRARVLSAVRRLAEEGLGSLAYPEAYGGGSSPASAIAAFETLAFGDLSIVVKYGVQFGLFGGSIAQLGTEPHHRRYLPEIGTLALPGCYAMTEIGHGSNVRDLETRATWDPSARGFRIVTPHEKAGKEWIGNAALHGRMATVFAQLEVAGEDHGVHAFVVPIRDEKGRVVRGVRIEDNGPKVGLNGVDNGRIWFDDVVVPREALLDRFASVDEDGEYHSPIPSAGRRFFTMLGTLVAGRISIAAASVSVAKTALAVGVPYSARRRQFGPEGEAEVPVLTYTTQQRLLLPRLAATYAHHFAARALAERYERVLAGEGDETASRELEAQAAGLKALASWHAMDTLQAVRESMGGRGFHADNRLGRLRDDTDIFTTFEGANAVLLQLVAKSLLVRFREEMGDLRFWDAVRWVAERAQTRVTELNPVVVRRHDEEHLRDPDFHLAAFQYREERLLASAARRLKGRLDAGMGSFAAMNEVQDHLVALARAHTECLLLDAILEGVKRAPTPGISETLRTLACLFALERLEADRAWFLEAGYFEGPKSEAIRAQVNRLCRDVAEQAEFLV